MAEHATLVLALLGCGAGLGVDILLGMALFALLRVLWGFWKDT